MRLYVIQDDGRLGLALDLDDEPEGLDLADGLGEAILDLAVGEMLDMIEQGKDPETRRPWENNAPGTKKKKGHGRVGYDTGAMLNPDNWTSGERDVTSRALRWYWAGPDHGVFFHSGVPEKGQPARPIVGWGVGTTRAARELIESHAQALEG